MAALKAQMKPNEDEADVRTARQHRRRHRLIVNHQASGIFMAPARRIVCKVFTAAWMLLSLLLGTSIAAAQSQPAVRTTSRVSTQCWFVLGGGEFKRGFDKISTNGTNAAADAMRTLLSEAQRAGQVQILAQRELLSADQVGAKLSALVEVPTPAGREIAPTQDRSLFIEMSLTPQLQADQYILLSLRLDLKALTPKLSIGEAAELVGPRSVSSKVLLQPGEAFLLNLTNNDVGESLANPTRVKGQDVLLLMAPKVVEGDTPR